jgi:hypothetical protein
MAKISRCVFCGSPNYGRGCRYGPKGYHFHPDDSTKCSWCGSPNYGKGCRFNPNGTEHVHGINYNPMIKEAINNQFLLKELNKPFTEFQAYKLKLIDSNGSIIKEPVTEQEIMSLTPTVKTILKIKKYLGSKLDIINSSVVLENSAKVKYTKESYSKLIELEEQISDIYAELHKTVAQAHTDGISLEEINAVLQK